ncbi:hypothetical protein LUZ60_017519 [Juncus effusus]|nr:hypothetical protein LUZ60_017519 [Juncus effusus]
MFLYTLAKNASNRTVQERFQHSGCSVSAYFGKILNAKLQLSTEIIRFSSLLTPREISNSTKFNPYFKDCIGVIDGTHVPITVQGQIQDPYRNRKQTLSQNVMVACNFDNRFIFVLAGWEGSASDALILKSAIDECNFYVPSDKFYLVDAGYANTPNFIAPYRGVRYHLNEQAKANKRPKDYKELFNLRHSQLRNHVESIIGVLKMRFPILKTATYHTLDSQRDIVTAACVLHNFIVNHNGDMNSESTPEISPNEFVAIPDGDSIYDGNVESLNNERQTGALKRNEIAMKMWEDYDNNYRNRQS